MSSFQGPPNTQSQLSSPASTTAVHNKVTVEQQKSPSLFIGWTLLPMRLFLGITFVYAGIQKLTDPQFFRKATPGYIGNQIIGFAHASPLHNILIQTVLPHAVLFGYAIAFGEIAIGLGTLFGLLFRPAAFFGLILSLLFFLSASWHVYPYFYGADIVFAFCWIIMLLHGPVATGYPTLDAWLMTTFFPQQAPGLVSFIRTLLIGSPDMPQSAILVDANDEVTSPRQGNAQQRIRAITQRKREKRRSFLQGAIAGMSTIVGLGIVGFVVNSLFSNGASNAGQSTTSNAPPTPLPAGGNTPTSAGSKMVIAQVSAVAKNNATTFTIPSSGDPGVLVHLSNDQFVAYDATCTHAGCQVDYDPTSQHLICPCHGAEYDPAHQAAVLTGPTSTPLTSIAIHVDSATGAIMLQ